MTAFHDLDLSATPMAGYRLVERRRDLEGPYSQMYLAVSQDHTAAAGQFLVKLVDASQLTASEIESQIDDEEVTGFYAKLTAQESEYFVRILDAHTIRATDALPNLLVRVSDYIADAHYLIERGSDALVAQALCNPDVVANIISRIVYATRIANDHG